MKTTILTVLSLFGVACGINDPAPMVPHCGTYTHLDTQSGMCVADWPIPQKDTCGEGTEWQDGKCVPSNPNTEVCDGKDNNNNGQIDESDPNLGKLCVKEGWQKLTPQWGSLLCGYNAVGEKMLMCSGPSKILPESCNGIDDNADGQVDENCTQKPTQIKILNIYPKINDLNISFEVHLSGPARIYFYGKYNFSSPWTIWSWTSKMLTNFTFKYKLTNKLNSNLYWRIEIRDIQDNPLDSIISVLFP